MPAEFYAHTTKDGTPWEHLFTPWDEDSSRHRLPQNPSLSCSGQNAKSCTHCKSLEPQHGHLNKVAYWTAKFTANMLPPAHPDREIFAQWGHLTGLWHDMGKFSTNFQSYLEKATDSHNDEVLEKIDHTSAGAKFAISENPHGHLIANAIAGHHAGLLDTLNNGACLKKRLSKELPDISQAPDQVLQANLPNIPSILSPHTQPTLFSYSFFQRMIFSALVDADFLATEAFMNPSQSKERTRIAEDTFPLALACLERKIESFGFPQSSVNKARASALADCMNAAAEPPGLFSLTVPTGGGKTLSSLAFALKHANQHQHQRIIYVIPFTSIIEQNARVFKDLLAPLGNDIVLEHHSNLSPETEREETTASRLATENWDAPIIVTTAVQFYESLFSAKTSRARKLHNIANSTIILDEAQTIPVQYLTPCLRALEELTARYHSTAVLCTATQPTLQKSEHFSIGLENIREIITKPQDLSQQLERVRVTYRNQLADGTIAEEILATDQALCIVNTRKHAQALAQLIGEKEGHYHLSALMCPQHRLRVLDAVRQRLIEGLPTRLISTQLIEAGVDIDFPVVYRSMAGLDSISQAAGRCNREGKIGRGEVHIFHSEHQASERFFRETANVGHEVLDLYKDAPLSLSAIKAYFTKYLYNQESKWDSKGIIDHFKPGDKELPFLFQYRTASDNFKLIENQQIPIIIPHNEEAKQIIDDELRNEAIPLNRNLLRKIQRYTVQIYEAPFFKNRHQFETLRDGQFHVLICPEAHYSELYGLVLNGEAVN